MKKCEGACEIHIGEVVTVHVETGSGHDWGEFDYCEVAIEEDRLRGFFVTPSNNRMNLTASRISDQDGKVS